MNKNKISILLCVFICCFLFLSGCNTSGYNDLEKDTEKISIVCTTFPQYDWVKEIIGKNSKRFEVTLLLDSGIDLHSYQPTIEDISKISTADIFIYTGGESDEWTKDILRETTNQSIQTVNMLEVLGDAAKIEESIEGMQETQHHEEHSKNDKHNEHNQHNEPEYDEHIWLSLKNAGLLVQSICQQIIQADTEYAEVYRYNAKQYIQKLEELDKQYLQMISTAKYHTLLFGDRFPFRYLADDYNLDYYAAFSGCSAESEAGFETITFLSQKADALNLPVILTLENSNVQIAETIKQNTKAKNQKILVLNSIQSVTNTDIENHFTYLTAMQENLKVLSQALNG